MNTMIEYNVFTIDNGLQSLCKSEACTKIKGIPDCRPQIRSLETKGEPVVWVSFEKEGLFLWVFKEEGGRLGDGMGCVLYIPAGFRNCVPELWKGVKGLVKDSVTGQEKWEALLSNARQHGPEEAIPFGESRKGGGFAYVSIGLNDGRYNEQELSRQIDQEIYYKYEAVFFLTKGQTVKSQAGMLWKAENALILKNVSYVKPPKRTENYVPVWEGRPLRESWKRYIDKLPEKAEYVRWEREHWKTIERTFELKPGIVEVPSLDAKEEEKKLLIPRSVFTVGPNCELKINGCEFVKERPVELKEGVDAEIVASGSRYGECKASKSFAEMQYIVENGKTINLRWSYEIKLSEAELHQLFPGDFATQGVQCTFSVKEGQYSKEEFRTRLTRLFGRASGSLYSDSCEKQRNRGVDAGTRAGADGRGEANSFPGGRYGMETPKSLDEESSNGDKLSKSRKGKRKRRSDKLEDYRPKKSGGKIKKQKKPGKSKRILLWGGGGLACLALAACLCFVWPGFLRGDDCGQDQGEGDGNKKAETTEAKAHLSFEDELLEFVKTSHKAKDVAQWFKDRRSKWEDLDIAFDIKYLLELCNEVPESETLTSCFISSRDSLTSVVRGWCEQLKTKLSSQKEDADLYALLRKDKWQAADFYENEPSRMWYDAFNTYDVDMMKQLLDSISLTGLPNLEQIRQLLDNSDVCKEMERRELYDQDGSRGSITISKYLEKLKTMQSSSKESHSSSADKNESSVQGKKTQG